MKRVLTPMLRYQAWANQALLQALSTMEEGRAATGLAIMRHVLEVEAVFARRLAQAQPLPLPAETTGASDAGVSEVTTRLAALDSWFFEVLAGFDDGELGQPIAFTFLDGDRGFMTPAEILTHLVLHGGYHRGEAGRSMIAQAGQPPWDTFAVFLHEDEPGRRVQGASLHEVGVGTANARL